jgi:hypothetical protein
MNMLVSSTIAGTAIPAAADAAILSAAPKALTIDTAHASQELADLILALEKVHDVLKEKQEAFDAVYEQWRIWSKANPEPRKYGTRVYRKWSKRQEKFMEQSGFCEARGEQIDAAQVQQEARLAVAKFESRHLNDVALKVAAAVLFEGGQKSVKGGIICQGLTIDLMRMSVAGSYPVLN